MQQGGDEQKAALLWHTIYDSTTDKIIRKNALEHLQALQVDREVTQLEALVDAFQQRTGRKPSNLSEMVAMGWLRGIPVDSTGEPYVLTSEGTIEVQKPSTIPFITKGLPPGTEVHSGIHIPMARPQ